MRTECIGKTKYCALPSFALGVAGSVNLNQHFALDANFLTTPESSTSSSNLSGGRATEFLVGVRAEVRARHYGFFLKAQPGYFNWNNVITGVTYPSPSTFVFSYGNRNHFVSDVGAGFEYSPGPRIHVRGEVTDLILHFGGSTWSNNLQPSVGVYYGLEKKLEWKAPVYKPRKAHQFFSSPNVVLITGSVLAMTADAITTQRFLANGVDEGDPFAKPLVKYGWSGQASAVLLEIAAETLGMYGLHRIGQHWIERIVPVGLGITHGVFAYNNTKYNKPAQ